MFQPFWCFGILSKSIPPQVSSMYLTRKSGMLVYLNTMQTENLCTSCLWFVGNIDGSVHQLNQLTRNIIWAEKQMSWWNILSIPTVTCLHAQHALVSCWYTLDALSHTPALGRNNTIDDECCAALSLNLANLTALRELDLRSKSPVLAGNLYKQICTKASWLNL